MRNPTYEWMHPGTGELLEIRAVDWVEDDSGYGWVYEIPVACTAAELASIARQLAMHESRTIDGCDLSAQEWAQKQRDAEVTLTIKDDQ